ncbi:hypothetical protein GCM10009753_50390 [Streptantibioticus ferralitis]
MAAWITALWGCQDAAVNHELIRGWDRWTAGRFREHVFDGGHFYLVPQLERVVDVMRAQLRDCPLYGRSSMRWNA